MICMIIPAYSENTAWDCPECGRTGNTGNFCGKCAHPAPWLGMEMTPQLMPEPTPKPTPEPVSEPVSEPAPESLTDSLSSITAQDVGSIVKFGSYEQDNKNNNGKEPIEWVILSVDGNKALLISQKGLDAQPYDTTQTDVTWEKCSLRTWLNEEFYKLAFTENERKRIILTETDNSPSQDLTNHSNKGGNNTLDKVFLLSNKEAIEDYEDVLQLNPCESTEYAKAQGAYTWNGFFGWKLRTPWPADGFGLLEVQEYSGKPYIVVNDKSDAVCGAIRPAIWVDLSAAQ